MRLHDPSTNGALSSLEQRLGPLAPSLRTLPRKVTLNQSQQLATRMRRQAFLQHTWKTPSTLARLVSCPFRQQSARYLQAPAVKLQLHASPVHRMQPAVAPAEPQDLLRWSKEVVSIHSA